MYKTIEELVTKVDERNSDGTISELIGVSIDKCFIKSVANTNGTDLSKYKIIRRNEDRKSTRLNSSHRSQSRMPSSA